MHPVGRAWPSNSRGVIHHGGGSPGLCRLTLAAACGNACKGCFFVTVYLNASVITSGGGASAGRLASRRGRTRAARCAWLVAGAALMLATGCGGHAGVAAQAPVAVP